MLWASVIGAGVPYLGAETSGVYAGFSASTYGTLNPQPANVVAEGSEITLLRWRSSNGSLDLWLDGDQTTWVTGKSLTIGNNTYAFADASFVTLDDGVTQTRWFDASTTVIADGRGYQIGIA